MQIEIEWNQYMKMNEWNPVADDCVWMLLTEVELLQ